MKERKDKTLSWSDFPFLVCPPNKSIWSLCKKQCVQKSRAVTEKSEWHLSWNALSLPWSQTGWVSCSPGLTPAHGAGSIYLEWMSWKPLLCMSGPMLAPRGVGRVREAWCRRPPSALWWSPGLEGEAWSWGGHSCRSMLFFGSQPHLLSHALSRCLWPIRWQYCPPSALGILTLPGT